jgi:thiamine-phosphate pyrophosphorylase
LTEPILRILDANANRAREGLRVLEDVARFVLDHEALRERAKACRHEITRQVAGLGGVSAGRGRESEGDVGRHGFGGDEARRDAVGGIVVANARRAEEALRVLEEFSKLSDPAVSSRLKDLRYSVYTLEKEILAALAARGMDG